MRDVRTVEFLRDWANKRSGETDEISVNLAQSLVQAGVARYVTLEAQPQMSAVRPAEMQAVQPSEAPSLHPNETKADTSAEVLSDSADLTQHSMKQLRELAATLGAPARRTKSEQIAEIEAVQAQ